MRRNTGRIALAALAVAAVAVLATGCGAGHNSGGSSSSGQLTIAVDNGSPTLQKNFKPFAGSHRTATTYMYEPLEYVNTLNGAYTPFLATGHSFVGNTKVQFTIRKGVKWSDGKPFTPQDVMFTFDLLKKQPGLDTLGVWQHVKTVSASGSKVSFTFKGPDVPFAQQIASVPIVPQHVWSSVSNPTTFTNPNPVVTGPYVLDTFNPNQYTLKKNPTYWQAGRVPASTLVFPALTGNQSSQLSLSRGQYDWATLFIPNVKKTWVAKSPQTNKYWFPPGGVVSLFLNLTKAPFNSTAFRQGLSYSLDRGAVATKAEDGYVQPAAQSGLLLPNLNKWVDQSLPSQGKVSYDAARAKSLFASAGYHMSGSKLVGPNGKQVSFSIILPNGFTDWLQGAQVVQQQLAKAGISVQIKTPEYAAYFSSLQNGTFDTAFGRVRRDR
jgi:peptide/nickel transport system substrate-binding protein